MNERLVKGSHILAASRWVDQQLGPRTFLSLTEQAGDNWKILLPMAWYEIDTLYQALETVGRRLGISVEDATTEIATLNAETDLRSLYRVFLRIAQPQLVLSQTPRLWTTYVKFGSARAVENEKGHYIGQGEGFDEQLLPWACGCWRGFIPAAITVAGGRVKEAKILRTWRERNGTHSVQLSVKYD
jgi:hypothetical protein